MATRWFVLIGLVFARIACSFQLQTVAVVAPGLMEDLALNVVSIGTLVGLFTLPGLVLAIPGGLLSQWVGERKFMTACLVAMVAGALMCGFGENFVWLFSGRLVSGIGAIGIIVISGKIVTDWFAGKEIATAMAVNLAGFPVGIALALVTLGGRATAEGWPAAFFAAAGVSFIALVAFIVTYRTVEGAEDGDERAPRLSLGEIALVSLSGLIWALQNAMLILMVSFIPLFLISEGMAAGTATALVGIGLWVSIISVPVGGVFVDKFGRPNVVIILGMLVGRLGLLLVIPFSQSAPILLLLMVVLTFIGSLPAGPIVALAPEVMRQNVRAPGMGVFSTWLYGGLAFGPMLGGLVSDLAGDPTAPVYLIGALAILAIATLALFRSLQARGLPAAVTPNNA